MTSDTNPEAGGIARLPGVPNDSEGLPLAWPDPNAPGYYVDAWNGAYDYRTLMDEAPLWTADESTRVLAHGEGLITQDEAERRRALATEPHCNHDAPGTLPGDICECGAVIPERPDDWDALSPEARALWLRLANAAEDERVEAVATSYLPIDQPRLTRRPSYTLTAEDVGKRTIRAFGHTWLVINFIGRIYPHDVGKRVYLVRDAGTVGHLSVENDQQRDKRLGLGGSGINPAPQPAWIMSPQAHRRLNRTMSDAELSELAQECARDLANEPPGGGITEMVEVIYRTLTREY